MEGQMDLLSREMTGLWYFTVEVIISEKRISSSLTPEKILSCTFANRGSAIDFGLF